MRNFLGSNRRAKLENMILIWVTGVHCRMDTFGMKSPSPKNAIFCQPVFLPHTGLAFPSLGPYWVPPFPTSYGGGERWGEDLPISKHQDSVPIFSTQMLAPVPLFSLPNLLAMPNALQSGLDPPLHSRPGHPTA